MAEEPVTTRMLTPDEESTIRALASAIDADPGTFECYPSA